MDRAVNIHVRRWEMETDMPEGEREREKILSTLVVSLLGRIDLLTPVILSIPVGLCGQWAHLQILIIHPQHPGHSSVLVFTRIAVLTSLDISLRREWEFCLEAGVWPARGETAVPEHLSPSLSPDAAGENVKPDLGFDHGLCPSLLHDNSPATVLSKVITRMVL